MSLKSSADLKHNLSSLSPRQCDREDRAALSMIARLNHSVMRFNDRSGNRQSKPGTFAAHLIAGAARIGLVETFKDSLKVIGFQSWSMITHLNRKRAHLEFDRDFDAARSGVTHGILEQVVDHPCELRFVELRTQASRDRCERNGHASLLGSRCETRDQSFQEWLERYPFKFEVQTATFGE
jgi:hypothetical protein